MMKLKIKYERLFILNNVIILITCKILILKNFYHNLNNVLLVINAIIQITLLLFYQYQEMMFNSLACFLYLSSASYLAFATKLFLMTEYYLRPGFDVYPAMTAAYVSLLVQSEIVDLTLSLFRVIIICSPNQIRDKN